MTDVHTVASTPADHERTHRRHVRMWWSGGIIAAVALVFAIWFFQDPINYYGQRTVQTIKDGRPHVERIAVVPATTPDTVKATQLATTDDNRVAIIETTQVKTDLVDTLAGLKKQAADAKEAAEKAVAEAKASAEKLATSLKESADLKGSLASIQTTLEKTAEANKQLSEKFLAQQQKFHDDTVKVTVTPQEPRAASPASPKPRASNEPSKQLAYDDDDRRPAAGNGKVNFDRSGIPSNWEIRGGDFTKAKDCHGTVYVKSQKRLPDGGVRNFLGCR